MFFLMFIDNFTHINQLLMLLIFTSLLIYIECVNSAKEFKTIIENKDIDIMKQQDALLFPIIDGSKIVGFTLFSNTLIKITSIFFSKYASFSSEHTRLAVCSQRNSQKAQNTKHIVTNFIHNSKEFQY